MPEPPPVPPPYPPALQTATAGGHTSARPDDAAAVAPQARSIPPPPPAAIAPTPTPLARAPPPPPPPVEANTKTNETARTAPVQSCTSPLAPFRSRSGAVALHAPPPPLPCASPAAAAAAASLHSPPPLPANKQAATVHWDMIQSVQSATPSRTVAPAREDEPAAAAAAHSGPPPLPSNLQVHPTPPPLPKIEGEHARAMSYTGGVRRMMPPPLPVPSIPAATASTAAYTGSAPPPLVLPGRSTHLSVEPPSAGETPTPLFTPTPSASPGCMLSPSPLSAPAASTANPATRARIEGEILSTEASYLSNLQHFVSEFVVPLRTRAAMSSKRKEESPGLDEEQLGHIVGNIESITNFHVLFYKELQSEFDAATPGSGQSPNLARVFLQYADWFKLYTSYLNSYDACIMQMDQLKENVRFQKFVREEFVRKPRRSSAVFAAGKDAKPLHLLSPSAQPPVAQQQLGPMDYIIQPVQRLPRYVLLLKELLRHTPPTDTVHHSTIQQALTKIETVALFVNERKRSVENMNRLLQVSEKISGGMPDDLALIEPHRRILREGPVALVSSRSILGVGVGTVKISRVNFLLFNDLLLWTNEANKYKGSLDLNQTTITCGGDSKDKDSKEKEKDKAAGTGAAGAVGTDSSAGGDNMFQLSDAKATIMCKCNSPEEMKSWSDQIQQTITTLHQEKEVTRRRQRVLKARSRVTKGADHGARNELHSLIKGNLIQIPGSQDQLLQPEVEDDDAVVLLSPDPQLHADWLDKEVEAAQRRNQQPRQKHAPSDPGSSSHMMRGMLPREIIQQLKAAQFSSASVGGSASGAPSLQNSAANSTCTTVNSSAVNSRHQSRRPSLSEFTHQSSGSSSSHDRHSSNSKSLSADQDD